MTEPSRLINGDHPARHSFRTDCVSGQKWFRPVPEWFRRTRAGVPPGHRRRGGSASVGPGLKALEHLLTALIGSEALRSPDHGRAIGSVE
jgi:hypothetical protein